MQNTEIVKCFVTYPSSATSQNTHTRAFKFYWSKRQRVAVASAGPYASLHLAPDRQPHQHPTTHSVKALKAKLAKTLIQNICQTFLNVYNSQEWMYGSRWSWFLNLLISRCAAVAGTTMLADELAKMEIACWHILLSRDCGAGLKGWRLLQE